MDFRDFDKKGVKISVSQLSELHKLDALLKQGSYAIAIGNPPDPNRKNAYVYLEGDIKGAIGRGEDGQLIQAAWDLICSARDGKPVQKAPLPMALKPASAPKTPANSANAVANITVPPQFVKCGEAARDQFCRVCPDLKTADWPTVIENVYNLTQHPEVGGDFYNGFFPYAADTLGTVRDDHQFMKLRFKDLIATKLASPYVNEKSLGGYKGAASEILDLLQSIQRWRGNNFVGPGLISIPSANKDFTHLDFDPTGVTKSETGKGAAKQDLLEQDIDRTEVINNIKYYIEVKADAHTAVEKHGRSRKQLLRILAVVRNRQTKRSKTFGVMNREPAVSITDPSGWLELFTSGTAHVYRSMGFHLFVQGLILSPNDIKAIDSEVWRAAGIKDPLPTAYGDRTKHLATLNTYFEQQRKAFPGPIALWKANFKL